MKRWVLLWVYNNISRHWLNFLYWRHCRKHGRPMRSRLARITKADIEWATRRARELGLK